MKVLIIDDSDYKIQSMCSLLKHRSPTSQIEIARTFQSGIRRLKDLRPDLVLLDMSLPTSETSEGELEGRMRIFGGRETLAEMDFHGITAKVIVVTQFDHFGEPPNSIDRETLLAQLQKTYPRLLIGGIYYSNVDSLWQQRLIKLLEKANLEGV